MLLWTKKKEELAFDLTYCSITINYSIPGLIGHTEGGVDLTKVVADLLRDLARYPDVIQKLVLKQSEFEVVAFMKEEYWYKLYVRTRFSPYVPNFFKHTSYEGVLYLSSDYFMNRVLDEASMKAEYHEIPYEYTKISLGLETDEFITYKYELVFHYDPSSGYVEKDGIYVLDGADIDIEKFKHYATGSIKPLKGVWVLERFYPINLREVKQQLFMPMPMNVGVVLATLFQNLPEISSKRFRFAFSHYELLQDNVRLYFLWTPLEDKLQLYPHLYIDIPLTSLKRLLEQAGLDMQILNTAIYENTYRVDVWLYVNLDIGVENVLLHVELWKLSEKP